MFKKARGSGQGPVHYRYSGGTLNSAHDAPFILLNASCSAVLSPFLEIRISDQPEDSVSLGASCL
eukprot:gene3071-biopygen11829